MVRSRVLLLHEPVSVASGSAPGSVYVSAPIPVASNIVGLILHVLVAAAPTGTTPGLTVELDTTTVYGGGSGFARLGGAITALSAIGDTAIPYYTSSTQGAVPANTTFVQVKATLANADNVFPDVSVDLIELF